MFYCRLVVVMYVLVHILYMVIMKSYTKYGKEKSAKRTKRSKKKLINKKIISSITLSLRACVAIQFSLVA